MFHQGEGAWGLENGGGEELGLVGEEFYPFFSFFLINYFLFYKWSLFILFEKVWRFLASFSLFLHFVDFSSFYFYLKGVQIL